jgi:hypothetical protein
MTPEMLRSAVAAAIAVRPASRSAAPPGRPRGFHPDTERVSDSSCRTTGRPSSPEHAFVVRHIADGAESTVVVSIDPRRWTASPDSRSAASNLEARSGAYRPNVSYRPTCGRKESHRPDGRLTVSDISREDSRRRRAVGAD